MREDQLRQEWTARISVCLWRANAAMVCRRLDELSDLPGKDAAERSCPPRAGAPRWRNCTTTGEHASGSPRPVYFRARQRAGGGLSDPPPVQRTPDELFNGAITGRGSFEPRDPRLGVTPSSYSTVKDNARTAEASHTKQADYAVSLQGGPSGLPGGPAQPFSEGHFSGGATLRTQPPGMVRAGAGAGREKPPAI